jgi:hypothetical protein
VDPDNYVHSMLHVLFDKWYVLELLTPKDMYQRHRCLKKL